MDPTRDNPILRFNTFWWALWTFLIFAVLLAATLLFNRNPPTNLEDAAALARYTTKDKILTAQAAALAPADIEAAIPKVAASLPSNKPAAVETPAQVVPGSPTALKLAAEPAAAPNGAPASAGVSAPVAPTVPAVKPPAEVAPAPPPTGTPAQP